MRAVFQNRVTRVPTEAELGSGFSSTIGTFPPNSGRLDTLLGFLGVQVSGSMLPQKNIKNLRSSNCWKCIEIANPTNVHHINFVPFKIFYDPIRRTFLAPAPRTSLPTGLYLTVKHVVRNLNFNRALFFIRNVVMDSFNII